MINLLALVLLASTFAHAEVTQQTIEADCQQIQHFAAKGQALYQRKQYTNARKVFEEQVAWSESCEVSESKMAEAYNNVALTYSHQQQYLMAQAWLKLAPTDKKSIFNLNKIHKQIQRANQQTGMQPTGEYWQYAGKSLWNVISIKKAQSKYRVDFNGFYVTPMTMYYGPNMGDFSTLLDIQDGQAHYDMTTEGDGLDCVYDVQISATTLTVTQLSGNNCGFGHNVRADGSYQKVKHF
jgi:tetratricopeptide (TPR) repeat protein